MTNLYPLTIPDFPTPKIYLKGYRDITNRGVAPNFNVLTITWSSLLGMGNEELLKLAIFNNSKFIAFVTQTRKDFKLNHKNYRKYPKMNEKDWK